jgi:23S rRNA pseudouridine1911/1915/1917 synthase
MKKNFTVPKELANTRLDQTVSILLPDYSRTELKSWIENNQILLNGQSVKPKVKVKEQDQIEIEIQEKPALEYPAQAIPLDIIYEDEAILVINKPAGLVVHPGAGNQDQTLLNALLHHAPSLRALPRAGILHRLDKNTTGLLIIAKTAEALQSLQRQLKKRTMGREYQAIVQGTIISGGTIDAPIGRHPYERTKMAVNENGKEAITHYRVLEKYRHHTRLTIKLETGRTHQIRVHLLHIHHPIVGDTTYSMRSKLRKNMGLHLKETIQTFKRQALHAYRLTIIHPKTQEPMQFDAPLPDDMQLLINALHNDQKENH